MSFLTISTIFGYFWLFLTILAMLTIFCYIQYFQFCCFWPFLTISKHFWQFLTTVYHFFYHFLPYLTIFDQFLPSYGWGNHLLRHWFKEYRFAALIIVILNHHRMHSSIILSSHPLPLPKKEGRIIESMVLRLLRQRQKTPGKLLSGTMKSTI